MEDSPSIPTPEEEEYERKIAELAGLEERVAAAEAELQALKAGLKAFEEDYLRVVGPCLAEMEHLKAEAAEIKARRKTEEQEAATCPSAAQAQCPPGELKNLFREVAKAIHPDLAPNDLERRRRDEIMMQANAAYASGSPEQLRDLLLQWKADPEAISGHDIGARLIRAIRRIARARNRILEIREHIKDIRKTDLYFLRQRAERAQADGRDLLAEMRANLERQLRHERHRVAGMHRGSA